MKREEQQSASSWCYLILQHHYCFLWIRVKYKKTQKSTEKHRKAHKFKQKYTKGTKSTEKHSPLRAVLYVYCYTEYCYTYTAQTAQVLILIWEEAPTNVWKLGAGQTNWTSSCFIFIFVTDLLLIIIITFCYFKLN